MNLLNQQALKASFRRCTALALLFASGLFQQSALASLAPPSLSDLPAEAREAIADASLSGSGKLTFYGLDVYQSSLWVAPSFKPARFEDHTFALELHYLRSFSADAIAQRSIEEMQRLQTLSDDQSAQWLSALRQALPPNVKKGDRLMGLHRPGTGVVFWNNGKRSGEVRDAEFARQFFAIWLSPKTSEPKLRRALLAKAP
jgi:Chalcone isomerase-like